MTSITSVRVIDGEAAKALLADESFIRRWQTLLERCPWATGFQTPGFARTWYSVYGDDFAPLLVVGLTSTGELCGLLQLAVAKGGEIGPAGGRQAEYQVWLTDLENAESFPSQALQAVQSRLTAPLHLRYLPPTTPLGWLSGPISESCLVEEVPRPVMAVSGEDIEQSWKKKSNKSRLNRLAKLGEVTFNRLTSRDQLDEVLDEIAVMYDIRQAAISGTLPFRDDPGKAAFHLALTETPDLLHTTVLKVGGQLVSAHIGVAWGHIAHVGILAHSPFFARHSPGKLHVMYLARQLASEGCSLLDLTPGSDQWKQRSATSFETVRRLTLFPSAAGRKRQDSRERLKQKAKRLVGAIGLSPSQVAEIAAGFRRKTPVTVARAIVRRTASLVSRSVELRGYTMALSATRDQAVDGKARRDHLEDLVKFTELPGSPTRQGFFRAAVGRLEQGHHAYTVLEGDQLVHWGWLSESEDHGQMSEVHQRFTYPAGSVALYDFYTVPACRGRGLYAATIRQMLVDAASGGHQCAYIFVEADNGPSRRVIEKSGFTYVLSMWERSFFGRTSRSRSDGPVESEAKAPDGQDDEDRPAVSSS